RVVRDASPRRPNRLPGSAYAGKNNQQRRIAMSMRPLGLSLIIGASFLAGTMVPAAGTQSSATPTPSNAVKYVEVDYMKVDPAKTTEYLKIEQDLWKPLHQELVKKGQVKSWTLYGVQFPSGTDE